MKLFSARLSAQLLLKYAVVSIFIIIGIALSSCVKNIESKEISRIESAGLEEARAETGNIAARYYVASQLFYDNPEEAENQMRKIFADGFANAGIWLALRKRVEDKNRASILIKSGELARKKDDTETELRIRTISLCDKISLSGMTKDRKTINKCIEELRTLDGVAPLLALFALSESKINIDNSDLIRHDAISHILKKEKSHRFEYLLACDFVSGRGIKKNISIAKRHLKPLAQIFLENDSIDAYCARAAALYSAIASSAEEKKSFRENSRKIEKN